MARQKITFTVMPRGVSLNTPTLPVSVFVSPRLYDDNLLGAFPDWLNWTRTLKDDGLSLTFRSGSKSLTLAIDTDPLRPELWEAIFNERTFVRSRDTFDDHTGRAIFSYPVRYALSTIKSMYQRAGIELALPEPNGFKGREQHESEHRLFLKRLLAGLQTNWDTKRGDALRDYYRKVFGDPLGTFFPPQYPAGNLSPDGLLKQMPADAADKFYRERMTEQFGVFNHVPPGKPIKDNPPDFDKLLDFHQALSSLNSYPALMRALGLVFDFDLPTDFVVPTTSQILTLSVVDLPGHAWDLQNTEAPPNARSLKTAYIYLHNPAQNTLLFATAPGIFGKVTSTLETFGLLNVEPTRYGLAQVDVDSALHKNIILAESWQDGAAVPAPPDHPEVFDPSTTLPALRSGGLSVFADGRALKLLSTLKQQKDFNDAVEGNQPPARDLYAEDLLHGYRLDVWDSLTNEWHSLHWRQSSYGLGDETFDVEKEEGFTQLAATQAAPDPDNPPPNDLYLHESIARWAGWSLSVPMLGKQLSSDPDPAKALDNPNPNEPATPFKMTTQYNIVKGTLPSLRFGRRYRVRARVVDICGNSLQVDDPITELLSRVGFALPADAEGFAYLRYEPLAAPVVVLRDVRSITDRGSSLERLVIRTFNSDQSKDSDAVDRTANERHIVPPQTSVEMAERLGMLDDAAGKLINSAAMYDLISARDQGELNQVEEEVAGQNQKFPLEAGEQIDPLPYLPDVLSRGAAFRDLPGTANGNLGVNEPTGKLEYKLLGDANPRPGSATLISFAGADDWQNLKSFRLALDEASGTHSAPEWDEENRVLTVFLPKGTMSITPLTSYMTPDDLKLMGVWQWLREYIDKITSEDPATDFLRVGSPIDQIEHILQRTVEGGHWMLTPPRLLTLVHAVQQPMGVPQFTAISVQHEPYGKPDDETLDASPEVLQTEPERAPTQETEFAPITAWRKPGSIDAYLMGGLKIHAASSVRVDLHAVWRDPIDDLSKPRKNSDENMESHSAQVDELPIHSTLEGLITVGEGTKNVRAVAYYDADHDQLCFVRKGDRFGNLPSHEPPWENPINFDAAPRHHLNDTRHHRITYTAIATSRFREYFPPDQAGGFSRTSAPVVVDVPASTRPAAPQIAYVVPTFGWQRQTQTNMKRSVRFGGGLRVYLERPWFSSGEGELLGVTLYNYGNGPLNRDTWKAYVTQWGGDPIWQTENLFQIPQQGNFPDAVSEASLSLDRPAPGRVDVVGFPVEFDEERQLWYSDLTINTEALVYAPFIRLALVRYQPHALPDSKLSRVVIADYAQLTPERSAVITADPYHSRRLRVTISGVAPKGPVPEITGGHTNDQVNKPTLVTVTVQQRHAKIKNELGWTDAPAGAASITDQTATAKSDLIRWTGVVEFAEPVAPGQYRLLIREYEYISANYTVPDVTLGRTRHFHPKRLIYAESVEVDSALISSPSFNTKTSLPE